MAIIYSYPTITNLETTDLFIISRLPQDPEEISNYSVTLNSLSTYIIDKAFNGTDNYIPKFDGTASLVNSIIYQDDDGHVGIGVPGSTPNPVHKFEVYDDRSENVSSDYTQVNSTVVGPPWTGGAGGVLSRLSTDGGSTFPYGISLIPGTTASDLAASGRLAFHSNSNLDTSSATGYSGQVTFDGSNPHWILGGNLTDATTRTLHVKGDMLVDTDLEVDGGLDVAGNISTTGDLTINKPSARLQLDSTGASVINLTGGLTGSNHSITFGNDSSPSTLPAKINFKQGGAGNELELAYGTPVSGYTNSVKIRATNTYFTDPLRIGADNAANELDDYEEGEFDLEWGYARLGGITFYDINDFSGNKSDTSKYVKIGRHVTVTSIFRWGSLPTAWTDTNALVFIKLPFTVSQGYYGNGTYNMFPGSTSAGSPCLFPESYGTSYSLLGMHRNTVGFYNDFVPLRVGDLPGIGPSGYVEVMLSFSFYTTD